MSLLIGIVLMAVAVVFGLQGWRLTDRRHAVRVSRTLVRHGARRATRFDPSMVADLPEPARRYFEYMIGTGTVLRSIVGIRMAGVIGLGTKEAPKYRQMRADQILAPPYGLVWNLRAGKGVMRISGSDGFDGQTSWVRFWLMGILPIVRAGGTMDHARAAFGRVVAESVFWTPAALLPGNGITWEAIDADVARATVKQNDYLQTVDVKVADDGRPTMVVIPRWSDANPEGVYQLQPFGGYLSEFRDVDGYRLPFRVEGGNFIGTEDYFPFYKISVTEIRFIDSS